MLQIIIYSALFMQTINHLCFCRVQYYRGYDFFEIFSMFMLCQMCFVIAAIGRLFLSCIGTTQCSREYQYSRLDGENTRVRQ